jgi:two-component system, cell cycle sensor histidine kinase PleC
MARLQEAVALSAEAFAFFDANDRLVMANDLYARICGVASLDEILHMPFPQIAADGVARGRIVLDEAPEQWLERRLRGHRSQAGAVTIRTNSGEAYLVRDRAAADGGRAMIFTDITDKVRAETALAEQQTALDRAAAQAEEQNGYLADLTHRLDQASAGVDSAKKTLLRTMGHELKTPLNAILGFSDLMATLADNLSPAQVREYAGLVHQGGSNLLKMINQIMDLTKISAGRYELLRGAVDAGGLLWLVRDAFSQKAEERGITIDADRAPIGLMVDVDEGVLTAMLHNLVDNAVTFTHELAVVRLSAVPCRDGVAISVEDTGGGVDEADLPRILEPFEHGGGNDAAQHSKGAGLGLTLVKAFAELQGGRLELSSAPGEGFKATIVLPAAIS